MDVGLAGPLPSAPAAASAGGSSTVGGRAAAKHAAAIQESAQQMLLIYLGLTNAEEEGEQGQQEGEPGRDFVPASHEEDEVEGRAASSLGDDEMEDAVGSAAGAGSASCSDDISPAAWLTRLEALRTLPPHADGCPVAAHLAAAWHTALAAVLTPEQQAAAGIGGGKAETAEDHEDSNDSDDMWLE